MAISRTIAWFVWIIVSIFYAYQYILRVMPGIMMNDIMQQFQIDSVIFGQFSGVYYIGYALAHIPIGIMLDRHGPKKIVTSCILLTVLGLAPMIFSEYWLFLIMGKVMMGIGSSAAILGVFKIIRMTFAEKYFSRMLSFSVTIGLLGAVYGGAPVNEMCSAMGYKAVVKIFAIIGIILAAITYIIIPSSKKETTPSIAADLMTVLGNSDVRALCISAGLMVAPLEGFADVWGAEFLKHAYNLNSITASYLPSMIFVGMCFGAPILSFIAEKTGKYYYTILGSGITMIAIFIAVMFANLSITSMTVSFVVVGICSAYQILSIYKASTMVPERLAGLTTAVANMIIMICGYGIHSLMGLMVKHYGRDITESLLHGVYVVPFCVYAGSLGIFGLILDERRAAKEAKEVANK